MKRYDNVLQTIGNTPVIRINKLAPSHVNLFVKVESFNPMGSVKDRLALGVIEDAERRGELKPGQTIVEASSGNTGIGLAMVCAQKGCVFRRCRPVIPAEGDSRFRRMPTGCGQGDVTVVDRCDEVKQQRCRRAFVCAWSRR